MLHLIDKPAELWKLWSVKASAIAAAFFTAAGAGWLALNEAQRIALLGLIGITPENRDGLVAAALFAAAFTSSLTLTLRALTQPKLEAARQAAAAPLHADTVPLERDGHA